MNTQESMRYALILSVFAHLLLLTWHPSSYQADSNEEAAVVIDLNNVEIGLQSDAHSIALGAFHGHQGQMSEQEITQKRRQIYLNYLEAVSQEIHARRLDFGRSDLIGLATYRFSIDSQGRFFNIHLVRSSGDPLLDETAFLAIKAASQKIKRPEAIGKQTLHVVEEVKFQHGLR